MDDHGRNPSSDQPILYVLDTNVLIHDPNALLNFEEHHVAIPMIVLEELDKLKSGHHSVAAECRQAIRLIDKTLGEASPEDVEVGVPIQRGKSGPKGLLSILMSKRSEPNSLLPENLNDNKIINHYESVLSNKFGKNATHRSLVHLLVKLLTEVTRPSRKCHSSTAPDWTSYGT